MTIKIKGIHGGTFYVGEHATIKEAVEAAVKKGVSLAGADLAHVDLTGADLHGADLRMADFTAANLTGADFTRADLQGANLYAKLREANLTKANLRDTDLCGSDLEDALLHEAYLHGARFNDYTRLPTGETWREYLDHVVPALLTAGGRPLDEVATEEHWECHDWDNCPIAVAFGVSTLVGVPMLLRPRVKQFIQLFDARLIPLDSVRKRESQEDVTCRRCPNEARYTSGLCGVCDVLENGGRGVRLSDIPHDEECCPGPICYGECMGIERSSEELGLDGDENQ